MDAVPEAVMNANHRVSLFTLLQGTILKPMLPNPDSQQLPLPLIPSVALRGCFILWVCWENNQLLFISTRKGSPTTLPAHTPLQEEGGDATDSLSKCIRKGEESSAPGHQRSKNITDDVCKHPCANTRGLLLDYLTLSKYILRK